MGNLLKDKVCVVTGGTRGIGKEIALLFVSEGAKVITTGRSSESPDWILSTNVKNLFYKGFDVSDSSMVSKTLLEIKKEHGSLDVLVNNAGIEFNELIGAINEEHMYSMFSSNVFGTILMTQYASRIMRQKKVSGSIINISSGVGITGNPGQAVYSATKGAVIAFTKSAAKELAPYSIRVNSVAPGLTNTEMIKQASQEALERRITRIAMGRIAEPNEIANAVLFLASDKASYITGQVLQVDGCSIN